MTQKLVRNTKNNKNLCMCDCAQATKSYDFKRNYNLLIHFLRGRQNSWNPVSSSGGCFHNLDFLWFIDTIFFQRGV